MSEQFTSADKDIAVKILWMGLLLLAVVVVFAVRLLWQGDIGETQKTEEISSHSTEITANSWKTAGNDSKASSPVKPDLNFSTDIANEKTEEQGKTNHLQTHIEKLNSAEEEIVLAGEETMALYYRQDISPSEKYQALAEFKELLETYELDAKMGLVDKAFGSEGELYSSTFFLLHARMHLLSETMADDESARRHIRQALQYYNKNASESGGPVLTAADLKKMIVALDKKVSARAD
ncbi:hypothetical protein [Lacimicrobium alkaliphilum]|uniref:hypothetical protein n=1 Tax=Lacimicrobium alkaliphilum TaxID=1526571 RepID=UPI00117A99C1|nr:hypothetical protein [Lacimicrobium alkaliphilum]